MTLSAGGDLLALIADLVGAEAVPEEFFNIGEGGIGDVREGFRREERLMGGDDHVGHGDEAREDVVIDDMARVVVEEDIRFFLVDIQAGGADLTLLDAFDKCFRVDECASGGVDEDHALLHEGDRAGVHHVSVLVR